MKSPPCTIACLLMLISAVPCLALRAGFAQQVLEETWTFNDTPSLETAENNLDNRDLQTRRCDRDGDGYNAIGRGCGGLDCNDRDPTIYPGADEVCGDAKDNSCDGIVDGIDGIDMYCLEDDEDLAARFESNVLSGTVELDDCLPSCIHRVTLERVNCIADTDCGGACSDETRLDQESAPGTGAGKQCASDDDCLPSNGRPSRRGWCTFVAGLCEAPISGADNCVDGPELIPTSSPSDEPSSSPSMVATLSPSVAPSDSPSNGPSLSPTVAASSLPTVAASSTPTIAESSSPTEVASSSPTITESSSPTEVASSSPTTTESSSPSDAPSSTPTEIPHNAAFMSGKHGIGFRIDGGINDISTNFDVAGFINQLKTDLIVPLHKISYVIVGISSGANGDRYLGPNTVLESVIPGSVASRDLFGEIVDALAVENIDVIAYMAAQGPAMLKNGESKAWDHPGTPFSTTPIYYSGFNDDGSVNVDNIDQADSFADRAALCAALHDVNGNTNAVGDANCAPSVRKWVRYVEQQYSSYTNLDLQSKLKLAYAEKIVEPYVIRYSQKPNFKGFWFDQGSSSHSDRTAVINTIRQHMPNAAIGWNNGVKNPLRNNNPGWEDFTFGHVDPVKNGNPNRCINYGMVLSAEQSDNGYVYENVSPASYTSGEVQFTYTQSTNPSLAHVFMPVAQKWNTGTLAWTDPLHGAEWMHRVTNAGGAFTWNIPRCMTSGAACQDFNTRWKLDTDEVSYVRSVYEALETVSQPGYNYSFSGVC